MTRALTLRLIATGISLLIGACASNSRNATENHAQVLFVCEHGNVKSLMATSYFNALARERNLPFHAISRGTAPDSTTVPPAIVNGLRSDGFDVSGFHPAAVTAADVSSATRVILINTELGANILDPSKSSEKWIDVPPASVNYEAARGALKAHVGILLDQLSTEHRPR